MKRLMGIISTVFVTGGLLVPTIDAQASTTVQTEVATQEEMSQNW
ncbi:hypothetical protein [Bacillus sp. SRB3LM]|nr:hypothetical protein [Bacillus sp. SRB3LM]